MWTKAGDPCRLDLLRSGQCIGNRNIVSHSRKEQRYKCKNCSKTFSETKGTAWYGIKKDGDLFV